jgi:hypothetical protein
MRVYRAACARDHAATFQLLVRAGAESPRDEIRDVRERLRRALNVKLAALSQTVIAALIREHDVGHRLEGVLKIIQASQTDALVRVLDERLARYLAQLLDDNSGKVASAQPNPVTLVEAGSPRYGRGKTPGARSSEALGHGTPRTRSK